MPWPARSNSLGARSYAEAARTCKQKEKRALFLARTMARTRAPHRRMKRSGPTPIVVEVTTYLARLLADIIPSPHNGKALVHTILEIGSHLLRRDRKSKTDQTPYPCPAHTGHRHGSRLHHFSETKKPIRPTLLIEQPKRGRTMPLILCGIHCIHAGSFAPATWNGKTRATYAATPTGPSLHFNAQINVQSESIAATSSTSLFVCLAALLKSVLSIKGQLHEGIERQDPRRIEATAHMHKRSNSTRPTRSRAGTSILSAGEIQHATDETAAAKPSNEQVTEEEPNCVEPSYLAPVCSPVCSDVMSCHVMSCRVMSRHVF